MHHVEIAQRGGIGIEEMVFLDRVISRRDRLHRQPSLLEKAAAQRKPKAQADTANAQRTIPSQTDRPTKSQRPEPPGSLCT